MTAASKVNSAAAMWSERLTTCRTADSAQDSTPPAFSRPVLTRLGNNTHPVKTLVPVDVKEDFARRARLAGYSGEGDCLRELVIAFTYGVDYLHKLHADRISHLSGIVPVAPGDGK